MALGRRRYTPTRCQSVTGLKFKLICPRQPVDHPPSAGGCGKLDPAELIFRGVCYPLPKAPSLVQMNDEACLFMGHIISYRCNQTLLFHFQQVFIPVLSVTSEALIIITTTGPQHLGDVGCLAATFVNLQHSWPLGT